MKILAVLILYILGAWIEQRGSLEKMSKLGWVITAGMLIMSIAIATTTNIPASFPFIEKLIRMYPS